jgi:hypothetical protein
VNGNGHGLSEDLLSLIIALVIFVLALGLLGGVVLLGWVITTGVWTDLSKALAPISKAYAGRRRRSCRHLYVGLLALMTAGAAALQADVGRFVLAFTAVFWISYLCWIIGSYANVAVNTPADMQKFGARQPDILLSELGKASFCTGSITSSDGANDRASVA